MKTQKTEELQITSTIQIFFQEQSIPFEEKKEREEEEIICGDSFLELLVIFQVLIFVFPIFCKLLADQKYP